MNFVFFFWIVVIGAGGEALGADVYAYNDPLVCEASRVGAVVDNGEVPGFHIAPECIKVPVPLRGEAA